MERMTMTINAVDADRTFNDMADDMARLRQEIEAMEQTAMRLNERGVKIKMKLDLDTKRTEKHIRNEIHLDGKPIK